MWSFFILIFIINDHNLNKKKKHLLFCTFLEYVQLLLNDNVDEEGK